MARAMETASVSASRVTATAPPTRSCQMSGEKVGTDSGGSEDGSAPTVVMVVTPICWNAIPSRLPPSMATIMYGQRGKKRRTVTPNNRVNRATVVM